MEVIIQNDAEAASKLAAGIVAKLVREKPNATLGFATGSTPELLYRELVRLHLEEGLDFSGVTTFNLDEYVGLAPDHECSYHYFMWDVLFSKINVPRERVHIPDGLSLDYNETCRAYEDAIKESGGIDLQILGIGENGHIAFNEPSSSLASRTRVTALSQQTILNNSRFFADEDSVPRHGLTMGVQTILDSERCLLLAFGFQKAHAVAATVEGPVTAMVTASALQLHARTTMVLDELAASDLKRADDYRWAFRHKLD